MPCSATTVVAAWMVNPITQLLITVFPPMLWCRGVYFVSYVNGHLYGWPLSTVSVLLPRHATAPPSQKSRVSKAAAVAPFCRFTNLATDAQFFSPWITIPPMTRLSLRCDFFVLTNASIFFHNDAVMYDNWSDSASLRSLERKFFERKINPFDHV